MRYKKLAIDRPVIRQSKLLPVRVAFKAPRRFKTLVRLLALNESSYPHHD